MLFAVREGAGRIVRGAGLARARGRGPRTPRRAGQLLAGSAPAAADPVREWLLAEAAGNPLALLELPKWPVRGAAGGPRRSARGGPVDLPAPVGLRAARRPFAGRDAHRVADRGARRQRTRWPRWCARRARRACPTDALDSAEQAGLLRVVGGRIVFRHPLVRSALLESSTHQPAPGRARGAGGGAERRRGRRPPRLAPGAGHADRGRRGRRGAGSVGASLSGARRTRLGRHGVRPRGRAERRRGPPNRPARRRRRGGVGRRAARARPRADRAGAPAHDGSARERSSCICAA